MKFKKGIFARPQIREDWKADNIDKSLDILQLKAWHAFKLICDNFLGNHKSPPYREEVQNWLAAYKEMQCWMSLKVYFFYLQLDFFPENIGAVSDEQSQRFYQDIQEIETRYQGFWNQSVMADYCLMSHRDKPNKMYKSKLYAQWFLVLLNL